MLSILVKTWLKNKMAVAVERCTGEPLHAGSVTRLNHTRTPDDVPGVSHGWMGEVRFFSWRM
jgi:hypothetical protein